MLPLSMESMTSNDAGDPSMADDLVGQSDGRDLDRMSSMILLAQNSK